MAAARRGAYRAEKRQKEIKRLKKQAEKRARRQSQAANRDAEPGEGETPGGGEEATEASEPSATE